MEFRAFAGVTEFFRVGQDLLAARQPAAVKEADQGKDDLRVAVRTLMQFHRKYRRAPNTEHRVGNRKGGAQSWRCHPAPLLHEAEIIPCMDRTRWRQRSLAPAARTPDIPLPSSGPV